MFNRKLKERVGKLEDDQKKLKRKLKRAGEHIGFLVGEGYDYYLTVPRFSVHQKTEKLLEYLRLEMIKVQPILAPEKIIIRKIRTPKKKGGKNDRTKNSRKALQK